VALIAFFRATREQLPLQPFRLTHWQFISDPARWYAALEADIAAGPRGVRARMGALQEDLRSLREHTERCVDAREIDAHGHERAVDGVISQVMEAK
jgi:hypothetical protein